MKLLPYREDRALRLTIHTVGDQPGKPNGQVRKRISMRSHDDGGGTDARCRTEDAFGGIAELDKKVSCALEGGGWTDECAQMLACRYFDILVGQSVFVKEIRMMRRHDMQYKQLALEIVCHRDRIRHGFGRSLVECSGKEQGSFRIGWIAEPGTGGMRTYRQHRAAAAL